MKSKKSPAIAARIEKYQQINSPWSPYYLGYFECFNEQSYYEAHDVLEELWLEDRNRPEASFYKGLIQLAGAFVHLQKHRLEPAFRLFLLAENNFISYENERPYLGIQLDRLLLLGSTYRHQLESSAFLINPWTPLHPPQIDLPHPYLSDSAITPPPG